MVLTFALCTTFVFAQTATPRMKECKAPAQAVQVQNDYSSSIFTKDATPLVTVDFSAENNGYSTGVVTGGVEAHAENYDFATWRRWANVEDATFQTASSIYPALAQSYFGGLENFANYSRSYLDTTVSSAENGWMMMSTYDQRTPYSGNFNAYIRIDNIDATEAGVVDIRMYQVYRKYYDNCYIDYSTDNGSTWNSMEINTTGVDISINGMLVGMSTYTLPVAAAGNEISIRIRYKSLDANRAAYGYFWMIDDVSAIAGDVNRLRRYAQEYVEGNYGMIPQNMTINPAWYSQVLNNGAAAQNNLTANLYHLNADQSTSTLVQSYDNGNFPVSTLKSIVVDRNGWLNVDSLDYRGWYGYIDHAAHGTGSALPTATAGDNYMYVQIGNDSVSYTYDTMYYQVTTSDNNEYRWAHDNGILTYSPFNHYLFGYVYNSGNWYVTEDPEEVHFYEAGYRLTSRYTTDQIVPENWVIHGVEIVASPVNGFHSTGAKISACLYTDVYEGGSVGFETVETGAAVKTIVDDDVNDSTVIGRLSNGYREVGQYNTVYIPFPEQPTLNANTSYRVGYTLEEDGYFAVAQEAQGSYRVASPTRPTTHDTIYYFRNSDATAKWANFYAPNQYQNFVADPSYGGDGSGSTFSSWYVDYNPMIRLVVGPAREVTRHNISIECTNEEYGSAVYGGEEACGVTLTPAEHSTITVAAQSAVGCRIAQILVDGTAVAESDYVIEYDETEAVYVAYYTFEDVTADHTINFVFEAMGIDPVAAGVRMNLKPNPATSQVSLNIEGVEGMVNCMLIDMSGRVVYNQNLNAAAAQTINVSNLAKGAYFVRITNDKFSKVEKLIVR